MNPESAFAARAQAPASSCPKCGTPAAFLDRPPYYEPDGDLLVWSCIWCRYETSTRPVDDKRNEAAA